MAKVVNNFQSVITGTYYGDSNQDAIWAGQGMPPNYLENFDFSQAIFYSFEQINFNYMPMEMPGKATFSSAQFGDGLISNNVEIYGAWGRTDLIINLTQDGSLNMSNWQFKSGQYYSWVAGEDYVFINGAPGNHKVVGSPVSDTFVFDGKFSDYKVTSNGAGGFLVVDGAAGRDGSSNVTGVEYFQFQDRLVDTSTLAPISPEPPVTPGPSVTVHEVVLGLYASLYGRAAEKPGYEFWIGSLKDDGITVSNVKQATATFQQSQELGENFVKSQSTFFDATYGGLDDSQFIDALYKNIGGNAGDADGIQFWAKQLATLRAGGAGVQEARSQIAGTFVQALIGYDASTNAGDQDALLRQQTIENKIAVSQAYLTASGQSDGGILIPNSPTDPAYQAAIRAIDGVTFDPQTVTVALAGINNAVANHDLSYIV